jgi:hypothetical protein
MINETRFKDCATISLSGAMRGGREQAGRAAANPDHRDP